MHSEIIASRGNGRRWRCGLVILAASALLAQAQAARADCDQMVNWMKGEMNKPCPPGAELKQRSVDFVLTSVGPSPTIGGMWGSGGELKLDGHKLRGDVETFRLNRYGLRADGVGKPGKTMKFEWDTQSGSAQLGTLTLKLNCRQPYAYAASDNAKLGMNAFYAMTFAPGRECQGPVK